MLKFTGCAFMSYALRQHGSSLWRTIVKPTLCTLVSLVIGLPLSSGAIAQPAPLPTDIAPAPSPTTKPDPVAPVPITQKILGQWLTKEPLDGDMVMFVFAPEGKAYIVSGTAASGNAIANQFQYRIDDKSQPAHLDVILAGDATVETLFEFTANGDLRLQMLGTRPGKPRPAALTDNATLFQKISDDTTPPPSTELKKPSAEAK